MLAGGWVMDARLLLGIRDKMSREIFAEILEALNGKTMRAKVTVQNLRDAGFSRNTIYRALYALQEIGCICPMERGSWKVVYVNPKIIRPFWLKERKLENSIKGFDLRLERFMAGLLPPPDVLDDPVNPDRVDDIRNHHPKNPQDSDTENTDQDYPELCFGFVH
jgi:hypothetical protein